MAKRIIQEHHLIYENKEHKQGEVKSKIYKGEHWICTQLQRRKYFSKGFIKFLKLIILLNEDKAIDLDEISNEI